MDPTGTWIVFLGQEGVEIPPSLRNIYKRLKMILNQAIGFGRSDQVGYTVLLLNATLTVEAHRAGSHQGKGWERFTDSVISLLNREKENLVFFLWGAYAQRKGEVIDRDRHLVLESVHPSPLSASRGFFGNNHFSRCNNQKMAGRNQ